MNRPFSRRKNLARLVISLVVACLFFILMACGDDSSSGASLKTGLLIDERDGQSYKTVTIGKQVWMAENLNYKTEGSFCYGDDPANCTKYGRLYVWVAAIDMPEEECGSDRDCEISGVVQGVCPAGWHLPTKDEFETLITSAGGIKTAGIKLRTASGWSYDKGEDTYGFSALPAGNRVNENIYGDVGDGAWFWSSSEILTHDAYCLGLWFNDDDVGLGRRSKREAISVRCIKN